MIMTAEEIITSYKQAKHPVEQVQILADLNGCSRRTILDTLSSRGVNITSINDNRPRKWTDERIDELYKMIDDGLNRDEIAARFGVTRQRINDICWQLGLTKVNAASTARTVKTATNKK